LVKKSKNINFIKFLGVALVGMEEKNEEEIMKEKKKKKDL